MSVPKPNHNRSQSRVRLRFGRQCKRIQFRFSIKAIFALTGLAAILIGALNWLFRSHWPLLPTLALVPPIVAIFILLSLTENKIWRGVLLGGLAAIFTIVVSDEYELLSDSENWHEWPNNAFRLTQELLYIWIFFRIAGFALVGGCIEAIRLRYVSLGVYSLFATFIYYFGLILAFIWIVCNQYWT